MPVRYRNGRDVCVKKLPLPEVLEREGTYKQVAHSSKGGWEGGMVPRVELIVSKVNNLNETRVHGVCVCMIVCIVALHTASLSCTQQ